MDSDFYIKHVVNVSELKPASLFKVIMSPEFNRKLPNCCLAMMSAVESSDRLSSTTNSKCDCKNYKENFICDAVDIIWKERLEQNSRLFNGTKFRIHNVISSDDGKQVVMFLGVTDYKEYLGTNWAPNVKALQLRGIELHANSQAFLSDALGVGACVVTEDNFVVLLWRSQYCAEAPSMWDVPGGHAEPKKIVGDLSLKEIDVSTMNESAVVEEIFSSIVQEVIDEVNIPSEHLDSPLYMGTHCNNTSGGRPSLAFYIRCSLSSERIRSLYSQGIQQEADESTNITFISVDEIATLNTHKRDLWETLAPSAKGNLTIFSLAHGLK